MPDDPRRTDPPQRRRLIHRVADLRPGEGPLLALALLLHFLLFFAYGMLRPMRSEIQAEHAELQKYLYTGTFASMLVVVPLYTMLIAGRPRRVFLPVVYLFFATNLLVFWAMFGRSGGVALKWSELTYFVWVSVFNLFAVSIFWGFMADVFAPLQATRLFGLIAAGASLGNICGAATVGLLVGEIGRANLVLIAAALLASAAMVVWPLDRLARRLKRDQGDAAPVDPVAAKYAADGEAARDESPVPQTQRDPTLAARFRAMLQGLAVIVRSPYLIGICAFIFLFTVSSTFLDQSKSFFMQDAVTDREERAEFFAWVETGVNGATLLVQLFVVGRIMRLLGVGAALAALPAISMAGFVAIGFTLAPFSGGGSPGESAVTTALFALVAFEVAQRTARYALAKPSREVLFTVVSRDQKYRAKAFIDTVIYRGGDVSSAWVYSLLHEARGLSLSAVAFIAAPVGAAGVALALWLGRTQQRLNARDRGLKGPAITD